MALIVACTWFVLVGVVSTWAATTKRRPQPLDAREAPPISVFKPLCGADSELEANLRSFFVQDYPAFELLFGVKRLDDPAVAIVARLLQEFPHVSAKLLVHRTRGCANPKVENLMGIAPYARFELGLISDSNVRVAPDYLSELAATYAGCARPGIVTNLFRGVGEDGLGAALECVHLNGWNAAGIAMSPYFGDDLVVGKSMLFNLRQFEQLGGWNVVRNVLAEDFFIGKLFIEAGYEVTTAPSVISNVTTHMKMGAFVDRQVRWALLRWRVRPRLVAFEWTSYPLIVLPFAALSLGLHGATVWALCLILLRDVCGWWRLRGVNKLWLPVLLGPLRDVFMFYIWARASMKRHVTWRGQKLRVGANTLLRSVS